MQDSGGLRVYKRRLPAAAHPEIPFPRVRGEVALADGSNLDIVAALDEGEQLKEEGRVALHFQCDRAVVFVFHPAGQAEALGGVVGGSRAVIDNGWLSADHQVGQTGKTVHPKVYIALGISGAIQHKAGMQDSECIIAVNTNESAPIFEIADYGICGDLFKVTPMLTEAIKAQKAKKQ